MDAQQQLSNLTSEYSDIRASYKLHKLYDKGRITLAIAECESISNYGTLTTSDHETVKHIHSDLVWMLNTIKAFEFGKSSAKSVGAMINKSRKSLRDIIRDHLKPQTKLTTK